MPPVPVSWMSHVVTRHARQSTSETALPRMLRKSHRSNATAAPSFTTAASPPHNSKPSPRKTRLRAFSTCTSGRRAPTSTTRVAGPSARGGQK